MKQTHSTLSAIGLALALTGCASVGNERLRDQTQQSIAQSIVQGKTTKADVEATLGSANAVSFADNGNEIWRYRYAHSSAQARNFIPIVGLFARGADLTTKELVILFDANGVVMKYTLRDTKTVVNTGLVQ